MVDDALRAAVNIARQEQTLSVKALRSRLSSCGFSEDEIATALTAWANYAHPKRPNNKGTS